MKTLTQEEMEKFVKAADAFFGVISMARYNALPEKPSLEQIIKVSGEYVEAREALDG